MVYEQEKFATEEAADTYIAAYLRNYHPDGYGTWARKVRQGDGTFLVNISRGSSCD